MNSAQPLRQMYAENTRQALLDTGLRLFVERGFGSVSAEELVRAAGLSRGALYHHFGGKPGLFEAVLEQQQVSAVERITALTADRDDPVARALAGMDAFLDICGEPEYREIVLIQGPTALGWQRWRELDRRHFLDLLTAGVAGMTRAGLLASDVRPELTAASIYGMLTELSLTVADAEDAGTARDEARLLVRRMLAHHAVTPEDPRFHL